MKPRLYLAATILAAAVAIASCAPSQREIDNPLIEAANSMTMDISRVVMTDTATIINVDLYGYPGEHVRIGKESVLKVGDQTYGFKSAEGFSMDKWVRMPENGIISCTLTFQPVPLGSRAMDFIENDNGFKLFGIDLTGKAKYPKFPAGLPKELRRDNGSNEMPEQVFKCAATTVRVHLLGFREGMSRTVSLHTQPLLGGTETLTAEADPETNTAEFTFMQYGTIKVSLSAISNAGVYSHVWIEPGQTTDVYIDLGKTGRLLVERRAIEKTDEYRFFNYMCPAYTTGRYAAINRAYTHLQEPIRMTVKPEDGMNADDYASMVEQAYATALDSVQRSSHMTELQKLLNVMELDMELMQNAFAAPMMMAASASNGGTAAPVEFSAEHIRRMLRPIGFDDMKYAIDGLNFIFSTKLCDPAWANKVQLAEDNFYREYDEAWQLFSDASSDRLTDEGRARLERFAHPFFREACLTAEAAIRAAAAATEGKIRIEQTPDVGNDKVFDAIAERYAGNVVFVDFWNTWCTWCHVGFDNFARLKKSDIADKVVWLYIADESSPISVYKKTIAELNGGVHYRITEEQMAAVSKKLGIEGFPCYMIIGRDGTRDMRGDLSDPATAEKRLRAALEK